MTDNSDKLDFALIRFLLTLVQTQSMQQTANLLNLSQSGASRKLAKASEIFGTELFIRSGFRMIPSAKMNELHPKLEVLLKQHESLFASTNAFKPASMDRSFNIATMDHGILAILGPAIGPLLREAPNIQINFIESKSTSWSQLRHGEVDMLAYPYANIPSDCDSLPLYKCDYALVVRQGHPLEKRLQDHGTLTADDVISYPRISITVNRHTENSDYELSPINALDNQRTAITLPYFLAAPMLLTDTDCTLQMPLVSAQMLSKMLPVSVLPTTDMNKTQFEPRLVWHRSQSTDPSHQWLRAMIALHVRDFIKNQSDIVTDKI